MADPKIVEYVQTSLSEGVPIDEIRRALMDQGWADYEIEEALSTAQQASPAARPEAGGQQKQSESFSVMLNRIMSATENEYSTYYVYKVILEVVAFSIASLLLILVGLPFYIPVIAIVIMVPVAYMQISRVRSKANTTA